MWLIYGLRTILSPLTQTPYKVSLLIECCSHKTWIFKIIYTMHQKTTIHMMLFMMLMYQVLWVLEHIKFIIKPKPFPIIKPCNLYLTGLHNIVDERIVIRHVHHVINLNNHTCVLIYVLSTCTYLQSLLWC